MLLTSAQLRVVRNGTANAAGMRAGHPVRITGGRFAGRTGTYVSRCNGQAWWVEINGARFAITKKFVEPMKEAA